MVAITIDDLPTLSHDLIDSTEQIKYYNRILTTLDKFEIKATGFVLGKLIKEFNRKLINDFLEHGHNIGNHTFSHYDLNSVSCLKYESDIDKNESLLSGYSIAKKYFRYPLLHTGDTKAKQDSVNEYLLKKGFTIAPVTIDNDEADYNLKFVKAFIKRDTVLSELLGKQYVEHMIERSLHYDSLGIKIAKRPVKHILLLHMNFINSYYLDMLLSWYKANNWEFITLEEVLEDPVYGYKDKYIGKKGLSWLERITSN